MRPRAGAKRGQARRGQVLPLLGLFMFVIMGLAAMTIDLGRGWVMKRELQAAGDAAALAGAQFLPQDEAAAKAAALDYIARNPLREGAITGTKITFGCVAPALNCSPHNSIKVELSSTIDTTFGKVVDFNSIDSGERSIVTATQPKKYDIELVVDRTGSMSANGKIGFARGAIQTFLKMLDPKGTMVGMTVFPPAKAGQDTCGAYDNYSLTNDNWNVVPLSTDYADGFGNLNAGSNLVRQVGCLNPTGSTHYAIALNVGQAALQAQGRADAQNVIVFLTDGAANIAPPNATADQKARPCGSAVDAATAIKAAGTIIYSIAYTVTDPGCLKDSNTYGANKPEGIAPETALKAIASPTDYYFQPDAGALAAIFKDIAGELNGTKTRLQDDGSF